MVARPFFMTLPGYPGRMDEKELLNDLEYLQQTYPGEVRRCQRRIAVRSWSGNREKSREI